MRKESLKLTLAIFALCILVVNGPLLWSSAETLSPIEEGMRWAKKYKEADAELNRVYQDLMASRDIEGQKKLRSAQSAWIVFRDAEVESVKHDWRGGSGQGAAVNSALAILTSDRVRQLKER